jgi:uncharacterized protein (DUF1697 family)
MTRYVAMLRGVNVSGRNKLSMEDLRAIVSAAGAKNVRSYIQSGNAVFTSGRPVPVLVKDLRGRLQDALGSTVPVLVRTKEELEAVIDANPFLRPGVDPKTLHVTFLGAVPEQAAVTAAGATPAGVDEFQVIGREVFLLCPGGYGNTKLTNTFFEKKLGSEATTRNWKTVNALVELCRQS